MLRTLTLLDATYSQVNKIRNSPKHTDSDKQEAITKDLMNKVAVPQTQPKPKPMKLKRSNGYQQEEMASARTKMQRMTIEQAENSTDPTLTTHVKKSKGPKKV